MGLRFGAYRLSEEDRRLDGPSGPVALGDRACEVLKVLLARANAVVTKSDLLDAVWPGMAVEENTLQVHVSALRKALGPGAIRTVHGRGYQYMGPAPVEEPAPKGRVRSPGVRDEAEGATRILVVPFARVSAEGSEDVIAEGLWEDIAIELGRFRHLKVSPFRGAAGVDPAETARRMAMDFILEGTVRTSGGAIRINARLVDAETGAQVWGEHFDLAAAEVFAVQDSIVDAVISHMAFDLEDAAEAKRQRDPTTSETAYTYFLRARSAWRAGDEVTALEHAKTAVGIDPLYGRAHAYAAFFYAYSLCSQTLGLQSAETVVLAEAALESSVRLDRSDPLILQRAAMSHIMLGRPQDGLRFSEAARKISARDSETQVIHGHALIVTGRHDEGRALLEQTLSPEQRFAVPPSYYCSLGEGRHICRDYAGSLEALRTMAQQPPDTRMLMAANLCRLGDGAAARRLLADTPEGFDPARYVRHLAWTCALEEDVAHILESFSLAGIEA